MTRIYLSPPHMTGTELDLVHDAFASNWIAPLGPHVNAFEAEMCRRLEVPHAVALSSGTAALHLALMILGVKSGDRVLCSDLTFAASANAIRYVGAEPVFIDSDALSWNMDPNLLCEALKTADAAGCLPAACIVVDLYGQCADYDPIVEACALYGVPVIEDAAEALGATYKGRNAGTFGECAVLSFNGNKIITTSGGGMLLSTDPAITERALKLATQAREAAPHYQHEEVGYNYRLSNVLAAIGRGQLMGLDDKVAARRAHCAAYATALGDLPGITFMPEPDWSGANRWLTCIQVDAAAFGCDREALRCHLESLNIEARPVWKPMHLQPVFRDCAMVGGAVSERLFRDGLCLPSGSAMTTGERERVMAGVTTCPR